MRLYVVVSESPLYFKLTKSKKSPDYDLTSIKILITITLKSIELLKKIYDAVLRMGHFAAQWKVTKIILIPKPRQHL